MQAPDEPNILHGKVKQCVHIVGESRDELMIEIDKANEQLSSPTLMKVDNFYCDGCQTAPEPRGVTARTGGGHLSYKQAHKPTIQYDENANINDNVAAPRSPLVSSPSLATSTGRGVLHPSQPRSVLHSPQIKPASPDNFNGDRSKGCAFLTSCELYPDTVVKQCTQTLIDCGATGCFIDIEWAKLNNVPIYPLSKPIPVNNVNSTENDTGMITDITNVILRYENHSECTQLAVTRLGKQSMILGYNWLHNHNLEINW
jgi:hypothetical protein